jgi:hypothetical protein
MPQFPRGISLCNAKQNPSLLHDRSKPNQVKSISSRAARVIDPAQKEIAPGENVRLRAKNALLAGKTGSSLPKIVSRMPNKEPA